MNTSTLQKHLALYDVRNRSLSLNINQGFALFFRIEQGDPNADVGHPKFFKKKERDDIATFTIDSKDIGFPRRKRDMKEDIQHCVIKKQRTKCPFADNQPGDEFIEKSWGKLLETIPQLKYLFMFTVSQYLFL